MDIMQGDAFYIPFYIQNDGEGIDITTVSKVEICVGKLIKTYPDTITYENGAFNFPITQEESLKWSGRQRAQIRIKYDTGEVYGARLDPVDVSESVSKEVL